MTLVFDLESEFSVLVERQLLHILAKKRRGVFSAVEKNSKAVIPSVLLHVGSN